MNNEFSLNKRSLCSCDVSSFSQLLLIARLIVHYVVVSNLIVTSFCCELADALLLSWTSSSLKWEQRRKEHEITLLTIFLSHLKVESKSVWDINCQLLFELSSLVVIYPLFSLERWIQGQSSEEKMIEKLQMETSQN